MCLCVHEWKSPGTVQKPLPIPPSCGRKIHFQILRLIKAAAWGGEKERKRERERSGFYTKHWSAKMHTGLEPYFHWLCICGRKYCNISKLNFDS